MVVATDTRETRKGEPAIELCPNEFITSINPVPSLYD